MADVGRFGSLWRLIAGVGRTATRSVAFLTVDPVASALVTVNVSRSARHELVNTVMGGMLIGGSRTLYVDQDPSCTYAVEGHSLPDYFSSPADVVIVARRELGIGLVPVCEFYRAEQRWTYRSIAHAEALDSRAPGNLAAAIAALAPTAEPALVEALGGATQWEVETESGTIESQVWAEPSTLVEEIEQYLEEAEVSAGLGEHTDRQAFEDMPADVALLLMEIPRGALLRIAVLGELTLDTDATPLLAMIGDGTKAILRSHGAISGSDSGWTLTDLGRMVILGAAHHVGISAVSVNRLLADRDYLRRLSQ